MSEITPVAVVEDSADPKLILAVQQTGLETESAKTVLDTFTPFLRHAEKLRQQVSGIKVTDVSQVREMKLAREARLGLREIRLDAEKARKRLKEDSLRRGKAIDGAYNIIEFIISPLEKELQEQENFAVNREIARKAELKQSRTAQLLPLVQTPAELAGFLFEDMAEETFQNLLAATKQAHEARRLAALKAEQERIEAERRRQEEEAKIRAENERLKKEAEAKEAEYRKARQEAEERERRDAELRRRLQEESDRKQREIEEKARQERDKLQAEQEAARRKEEADRAALQRKLDEQAAAAKAEKQKLLEEIARKKREEDARKEQEEQLAKAEAERQRKLLAAPDREKLLAYVAALRAVTIPRVASNDAKLIASGANDYLKEFTAELEAAVKQL